MVRVGTTQKRAARGLPVALYLRAQPPSRIDSFSGVGAAEIMAVFADAVKIAIEVELAGKRGQIERRPFRPARKRVKIQRAKRS